MKAFLLSLTTFICAVGMAQTVTVTNTNDAGAGSLRQAIADANSTAGTTQIAFAIPTTDAGYNATTKVFTINISSAALPEITRAGLTINGRTQESTIGNNNVASLGTGGTVGIDGLTLDKVEGPEIQIQDGGGFNYGLKVKASNVTIKGLAVLGFGNAWNVQNANILYDKNANNGVCTDNIIGGAAHDLSAPVADANNGNNFLATGNTGGTLNHNIVINGNAMGGYMNASASGWSVYNNEFRKNGQAKNYTDGLDIAYLTTNCTVYGNLFAANGGNGFDTYTATGGHLIENNTITGNGTKENETAGIRCYGNNNTYRKNIIHSNFGAGIMVSSTSTNLVISKNSIYNNGNVLPVSTWGSKSNEIGIDLLASGDAHNKGTKPYITKNDNGDADNGANKLINFPVLTTVTIGGGNLTVKGYAPAGATIEFFKGDMFTGAVMPQGKTFLFDKVEGSADDADAGTGSYTGMVNGVDQGTETNANKFSFTVPAPSGFAAGDILTATATVTNVGTSEFGAGATAVSAATDVIPQLTCVYINASGDIVARFGYNNTTGSTVTEAVGSNNEITPGAQNQGQPTSFSSGVQSNVFNVTFPSSASRTWNLRGSSVTANSSSTMCPVDLEVTTSANNNTPATGDPVQITVTVKNLTAGIPATAVEILNTLGVDLQYVSYTASAGTFDSNTGVWSLPEVVNGAPQTLVITVVANGSGTLDAGVQSQNSPDPVTSNNSASESIAPSGSSGGGSGGVESDGSMADLMAKRMYNRIKSGEYFTLEQVDKLTTAADFKKENLSKTASLQNYVPTSGPQNTTGYVTSPTDLIGVTNALQVYAADYYKPSDVRLGAVLALETSGEVYSHTKVICDRLNGATLSDISTVTVKGKPFVMVKLVQADGTVDYAITFVAEEKSTGGFDINNKWQNDEYNFTANQKVFNFQVWSVSESTTKALVEDILDLLAADGALTYKNNIAAVEPAVYVESGFYQNGKLILNVSNKGGAFEMTLELDQSAQELSTARTLKTISVALDPSKTQEQVEVNTGYIFDTDFSITNPVSGIKDQLYFADGPWGIDYVPGNGGAKNVNFSVNAETGYTPQSNVFYQEREAVFAGDIKSYVTVYKALMPGGMAANLNPYTQLKFDASLTGFTQIQVTLVSREIEKWGDQFRKTISVSNGANGTYTVDFKDFTSAKGGVIDLDEITSVNFSLQNNSNTFINTAFTVGNVEFNQNGAAVGVEEFSTSREATFSLYPNPFASTTELRMELANRAEVIVELYNAAGQIVDRHDYGSQAAGSTTLTYERPNNLNTGVYLLKVITDGRSDVQQVLITK